MPRPMGLVQRRRLIDHAQDTAGATAAGIIGKLLNKRFARLKRELGSPKFTRKDRQGNLGKRLSDNGGKLRKDDPEFEDWQQWVDAFTDGLESALSPIVQDVYDADSKWWQSYGANPRPVDPQKIIDDYQRRTGRQIKQISEDTRDNTLAAISDWYNSDAGIKDLINTLSQWFDVDRAEMIARTESAYITSEVATDLYDQFGVEYWNVDRGREGFCTSGICDDMAAANPHTADDPKPPYHPNCWDGTVPANADGSTFIYGQADDG